MAYPWKPHQPKSSDLPLKSRSKEILTTRLPGITSDIPGPIARSSRSSGPYAPAIDLIPGWRIVSSTRERPRTFRFEPYLADNVINVLIYSSSRALICGFRVAIRALLNFPTRINSYAEARTIRGVGEKTALKVKPRFLSEPHSFPSTPGCRNGLVRDAQPCSFLWNALERPAHPADYPCDKIYARVIILLITFALFLLL